MLRKLLLLFILVVFMVGCAPQKPFYNTAVKDWATQQPASDANLTQTVFLLGDAGKPATQPLEPTFVLLKKQMQQAGNKSSIIYLGDNIYPNGLPDSTDKRRATAEKYLKTQLDLLANYEGKAIMIPGNHDWDRMGKHGLRYLKNQQDFVHEYLGKEGVFLPTDGCPGPVEVQLNQEVLLLVIDTQWWLHPWEKTGEEDGCDIETEYDVLIQLADIIKQNKDKKIIVAGHHPLFSNGLHGGHAKPTTHLFPLTDAKKNLYVPLPVLGSVYVFYRTVLGNVQDIPNPRYKALKKALLKIFETHPNLMYVAGHDHNLQYFKKGEQHYIVSGAGCKQTYTTHRKKAQFAYGHKGFSRVNFYDNGDVWLEFWVPSESEEGKMIFRQKLMNQPYLEEKVVAIAESDYTGQFREAQASTLLGAKGMKNALLGKNYRAEWAAKLDSIRVFDLGKEHGGLEIVKKGGGMQTKSLRLEAKNGKQYVLRTIEKFPENAVPEALRGTVGESIVKDQISASHPYAALVVPPLADAAGVYHTNPELVWLPDDPRLGKFQEDFGARLYLYEERPAKDWSDAEFFGNSKKIINTAKVLAKTQGDNDKYVDQDWVVKSRLFDIWLGDWDRHDDQWRWASFKDEKDRTFYRPIPRDRDQVFFFSDGFLLDIGSRKWGIRKFQGFHKEIRDVEGFSFNARYFDRSFTNAMSKAVWLKHAEALQKALTDELIEAALKRLPEPIFKLHGEEIIQKLKERRDNLKVYANDFYTFLSKEVSIVGTAKHEFIKVERLNDEETRVRMWKRKRKSGKKKHKIYDRVFKTSETKEIRIYALAGEDVIEIEGQVKKGIKIRVIGGDGKDEIKDQSKVSGPAKKTIAYDTPDTKLTKSTETKNRLSNEEGINAYERKDFVYDFTGPALSFAYNPDDGVFIGGGVTWKNQGFRKKPYASKHSITANIAPRTNSYNFYYIAEWRKVVKNWDVVLETDLRVPAFTNFYYGMGNETTKDRDEKQGFYRVRYSQIFVHPQLRKQSTNQHHTLSIGGYYQRVQIEEPDADEDRFVSTDPLSSALFDVGQSFVAGTVSYIADTRDNKSLPTKGIRLSLENSLVKGIGDEIRNINYYQFKGAFSFYASAGRTKRFTLAARVGGAINQGDFEFFQANTLGGFANLRGYNRMRFAGTSSFYQNTELRIKLFNFRTVLFPGGFGIMGINDVGRVWLEGENSDKWHNGYGGGIWITPFDTLSLIADYTTSEEGGRIFVRFGFLF
ncbi:MAG: BamA/TamA family outer membrane protein [Flammeovirgaceae bacterium]